MVARLSYATRCQIGAEVEAHDARIGAEPPHLSPTWQKTEPCARRAEDETAALQESADESKHSISTGVPAAPMRATP